MTRIITFCLFLVSSSSFAAERQVVIENWAPNLQAAVVDTVEQTEQLSDLEVKIYSSLMAETHLSETLSLDQEIHLAGLLSKLLGEPSYWTFLETIQGTELEDWMVRSEVLSFGSCNCDSTWDCASGYSCSASGCTSDPGSLSWGVCTKKTTETELSN